MREKKFSVVALVMGILNLIFSLGTLAVTCVCGGFWLVLVGFLSAAFNQDPNPPPQVLEMQNFMDVNFPGLLPYLIASMTFNIVMGVVLAVAGIGLLCMQNWARWLSIIYAFFMAMLQAASLIYVVAIMIPGLAALGERMEREQHRLNRPPGVVGPAGPPNSLQNNPALNAVWSFAYSGGHCLYALILFVMMLLPGVGRELSGRGGRDRYYDGYDDRGYGGPRRYDSY